MARNPYTQAIRDLEWQNQRQNAWVNYVSDIWGPSQFSGSGGNNYDLGADLAGFRGLLSSPRANEQGAATNYFDKIIGGAQRSIGALPRPNFGALGDAAQMQYLQGLNSSFLDQLTGLRTERAAAKQQTLSGMQEAALGAATQGWSPEQVEALVRSQAQTSGFNWKPGAFGFLDTMGPLYDVDEQTAQRDAWAQLGPQVAAGELSPEQAVALSQASPEGYATDPLGYFRSLTPQGGGLPAEAVQVLQEDVNQMLTQLAPNAAAEGAGPEIMPQIRQILRDRYAQDYQANPQAFDQVINSVLEQGISGTQFARYAAQAGPGAAPPPPPPPGAGAFGALPPGIPGWAQNQLMAQQLGIPEWALAQFLQRQAP